MTNTTYTLSDLEPLVRVLPSHINEDARVTLIGLIQCHVAYKNWPYANTLRQHLSLPMTEIEPLIKGIKELEELGFVDIVKRTSFSGGVPSWTIDNIASNDSIVLHKAVVILISGILESNGITGLINDTDRKSNEK